MAKKLIAISIMDKNNVMKNFRKKRLWYYLSATEQALFMELVYVASHGNWKTEFTCTNQYLYMNLNLTEKTLRKARQRLVDTGMIFYKSQKGRKQAGIYKWTESIRENREEKAAKKEEKKDSQIPDNSKYNNNSIKISIKGREDFANFYKLYPGTKRALKTELLHFTKKHEDFEEAAGELVPAIEKLIKWQQERLNMRRFVPENPTMKTWISDRRWEDQLENNF